MIRDKEAERIAAQLLDDAPELAQLLPGAHHYSAGDVTYFGLGVHPFEWSERRALTFEPQRRFEPLRLGVPFHSAGFLVMSLQIAGEELLGNGLGMPVELLSELSRFPQIHFGEIGPERPFMLDLQAPAKPRFGLLRRFWRWLTRKPEPQPPVFTGAMYGVFPR